MLLAGPIELTEGQQTLFVLVVYGGPVLFVLGPVLLLFLVLRAGGRPRGARGSTTRTRQHEPRPVDRWLSEDDRS